MDVCVSLEAEAGGMIQRDVVISLSSKDLTASNGDYLPRLINRELVFESQEDGYSQVSQCVQFTAIDDDIVEGAEEISVQLTVVTDQVKTNRPSLALLLILDNDGEIQFFINTCSVKISKA